MTESLCPACEFSIHQEKLPAPTQSNIEVAGHSLRSKHSRLVSIRKPQPGLKQSSSLYRAHPFGEREGEKFFLPYQNSEAYLVWGFVFQDLGLESWVRRIQINLIPQRHGSQSWESEQKTADKYKCTLGWTLGVSQGNKEFKLVYLNNIRRACLLPSVACGQHCPARNHITQK